MFRYQRWVLRGSDGFSDADLLLKGVVLPTSSVVASSFFAWHCSYCEPQKKMGLGLSLRPETCQPELRRWIFQAQTQNPHCHSRPSANSRL